VLFIVLVTVITITVLVLVSAVRMSSEMGFMESELGRLKAYTLCVSGMEFLKNRLASSTTTKIEYVDAAGVPYSPRLMMDGRDTRVYFTDIIEEKFQKHLVLDQPGKMWFIVNLQDSAGLIDIFTIDRNLFKNFLEYNEIPIENGDIILDSLFDWMDKDNLTRPSGAESNYYLERFGYSAPNRLPDCREEIVPVRGMTPSIYSRIGRFLDFSIENQGLNPNTMPAETFYLFKGMNDGIVQRVLQKREKDEIDGLAEFTLISGYNFPAYPLAFQFFTSNATYVKIKVPMDEKRYFYILFRLDRVGGMGSMRTARRSIGPGRMDSFTQDFEQYFRFSSWQEGTELIPVGNPND